MNTIKIYDGELIYRRGTWNNKGEKKVIEADPAYFHKENEYTFKGITAKTPTQLIFILGRLIQKELGVDYPIYIDISEINAKAIASVPSESERFDKLSELDLGWAK